MIHAAKLVAVTISFTYVVESLCLLRYRDRQEAVVQWPLALLVALQKGSCSVAFGLVGGFTKRHSAAGQVDRTVSEGT